MRNDGKGKEGAVVVGGGVVGLSVALELARKGLEVRLLDHPRPGRSATPAAAGMLSPLSEAAEAGPFLAAGLDSLARYPGWVASLREASGIDPWHRSDGKLRIARTPEGAERLEDLRARAREVGSPVRPLTPAQARDAAGVPLGPVTAALLLERDDQVDNRRLHAALHGAALAAGVRIETRPPVEALLPGEGPGGSPHGLRLRDGTRVETPRVVLAAGAWTGQIEGLSLPVPVHPVRGQMLAFEAGPALPSRVVETEDVYLVPRQDGRLLVGATVEDAGYEATLTTAARETLASRALAALPGLEGAPVVEHWCGLRPGTPDGNPVLGPVPGLSGVTLATGHFRNGILLAPWTGAAVARVAVGGEGPEIPEAFLPRRFATSQASSPRRPGIAPDAP